MLAQNGAIGFVVIVALQNLAAEPALALPAAFKANGDALAVLVLIVVGRAFLQFPNETRVGTVGRFFLAAGANAACISVIFCDLFSFRTNADAANQAISARSNIRRLGMRLAVVIVFVSRFRGSIVHTYSRRLCRRRYC